MSAQEIWKPIPGWPEYEASSFGRVASVKRGERQILSGGKTDTGYRNVLLYRNGDRVGRRIHQLIALTFHGPRPEGLEIRHLDGDQLNNAAANLAYGTHAENMADRAQHWTPRRERSPHCRHGHEFNEANTYRDPQGQRFCRTCAAARRRDYQIRQAFRAAGIAA